MWYPKMHQCQCLVCTRSECAIVAYMECLQCPLPLLYTGSVCKWRGSGVLDYF